MKSGAETPGTLPWRLLDGYQAIEGAYDELAEADSVRPQYGSFVRSVETLGRHELASRWENAKRALRDNGVTYNVVGDPQAGGRPWELDMMPLIIPAAEWHQLETALVQRTKLLNLILVDIYGSQQLLHGGLLPPSLVLQNPAFLRPCHGVRVPRDVYLHVHAVDLARSPQGQWWVLADRTQTPSGAGYALENRIVLSRSLPEAFRDCQVQRVASFFRAHRDALIALDPNRRDHPNVVLLSPGPYNETYFEHAYLARYLGLTLVEGGDLTVRDCRVFIKTLDGLDPVDVILRRLDDSFCDPLELRSDSSLGIPGLVEAARTGHVAIANALGSGAIETAAIMPFLSGLCRHLLGEELMLPSVRTQWGGQPGALQHVLDHLDTLVAKRAFASNNREPVFGRRLSEQEKAVLASEMRGRPDEFVAQEQVTLSTAPVWLGGRLEPRPVVLRTYVAAAGDSWVVMPGGLTRVASARDVPVVSMQRGGGSKDTWVLSDGPVSAVTLLTPSGAVRRERKAAELPSRVADNLFWLGRHAERAEHTMRLLRSVVARLTDEAATDQTPELLALLQVLVGLELLPPRIAQPMPIAEVERELLTFVFRQNPPAGLRQTLNELRRLAGAVRDRLSMDTWRILNQLHQDFRLRHGPIQFDDVTAHLNRMITDLAAFSGMEMENMARGHGWRFLDIGRRLERSMNLIGLMRQAVLVPAQENALLEPLLEVADSLMTYRRRYFARPLLPFVLDLLLADSTNARALAFQLMALSEHVQHLPRDPHAPSPTREERLIAKAVVTLREGDFEVLTRPDAAGQFPALVEFFDSIEQELRSLSDAISYYYFSHAEQRVS